MADRVGAHSIFGRHERVVGVIKRHIRALVPNVRAALLLGHLSHPVARIALRCGFLVAVLAACCDAPAMFGNAGFALDNQIARRPNQDVTVRR